MNLREDYIKLITILKLGLAQLTCIGDLMTCLLNERAMKSMR